MIDSSHFIYGDTLLTQPHLVKRCVDPESGRKIIVHTLNLFNYLTKSILNFIKQIIKLQKLRSPLAMEIIGFNIEKNNLNVFYIDEDFVKLDFSAMTERERELILLNLAQSVKFLHDNRIYHLNINDEILFINSSKVFKIGFLQPPLDATISPEGEELPFHECPIEFQDSFLFGLLAEEILNGKKRVDLLKQIWDFNLILEQNDSMIQRCLDLTAKSRPNFKEIVKHFETILNINTEQKTDKDNELETQKIDINDNEVMDAIKSIPCLFGACYLIPYGVEKQDLQKAQEIFETSDDPISMNNLAKLVITKDPERAVNLLLKSASTGFHVAEKNAGVLLLQNKRVKEAVTFLEKAVSHGNHDALLILEDTYFQSDKHKAFLCISKAAKHGDTKALVNLGLFHEHAWGTPQNFGAMSGSWALAVKIGSIQAINNLGVHIASIEESMKLWSGINDPVAHFNIANYYLHKERTDENYHHALELMRKSAESGYIPAMFNMAVLLKETNPEEADEWCKKASDAKTEELINIARMKEISQEATN